MADIYWPFPVSTVSEWPGARGTGWNDHIGTDFAVAQGTPLRATASGTVDIIWNDGLGAWVIDIYTPDGMVLRHGHLSAMYPKDGAWVSAGDIIGATGGAPGTPGAGLTTGPHLHWEIRNNGGWGAWGWYDPRNLNIKSFGGGGTPTPGGNQSAAKAAANRRRRIRRRKQEDPMHLVYLNPARQDGSAAYAIYKPGVPGSWEEFDTTDLAGQAANAMADQFGQPMGVSLKKWLDLQKRYSPAKK